MKICLVSQTDLQSGEGHKKRLFQFVELFKSAFGPENLTWICFIPVPLNTAKGFFHAIQRIRSLRASNRDSYSNFYPLFGFPRPFHNLLLQVQASLFLRLKFFKRPPDIIWAEMTCSAFPALPYKTSNRIPLIVDAHGIAEEHDLKAFQTEAKKELQVIHSADGIVAVSEKMQIYFSDKYGPLRSTREVVPCVTDFQLYRFQKDERLRIRNAFKISNRLVFVYSGGLAAWQGIDLYFEFVNFVFKAGPQLKTKPFFMFLTWVDDFSEIEKRFRELHLKPEDWLVKRLPHEEVPSYLSAADVAVIFRSATNINRVASPTKIGEYLACGLPLVMSAEIGDLSDFTKQNDLGIVIGASGSELQTLVNFLNSIQLDRDQQRARVTSLAEGYFGPHRFRKCIEMIHELKKNTE